MAAASVAGASHLALGAEGQDAHALAEVADGALVAAVADGAGSAPHGARGAAVAVAAAVGTLASALETAGERSADSDSTAVAAAARAAAAAVAALAAADGHAERDLACTLSCAVVRPGGVVAAQVGDGLVVARVDGGLVALTTPARGDYANETVFVTTPGAVDDAVASLRSVSGAVDGVALLTDGLLRLAVQLADATPHAAFFAPLFDFAAAAPDRAAADAALATFLASPRVRGRTDDDVTLVVAVPAAAPPGP